MDTVILDMLSRLFAASDACGFNVLDYVHAEGSPTFALFYARLCWPEFVEVDGMVFLKETVEDSADRGRVAQALGNHGGDRTKTEQSFNCHDLEDLFGSRAGEVTVEEGQLLAELLRDMWKAKLHQTWPGRQFCVEVTKSEPADESIAVMFWSVRS